jgi:putative ABC transport system permease protein
MLAVTLRGLLAHRVRLALTALAITLGTGLAAGSFVFSATLTRSLDSLFAQAATGTDVVVRHVAPPGAVLGAGSGGSRPIPAAIAAAVRAQPDVAAADGAVSGRAVLLGRNGKPLPSPFAVALSWPADTPFQATFTHRSGRPPAGRERVMIDRASARRGHFTVGDRIEIAIGGQAMPFVISGITGYGSADSIAGGSMAIFGTQTAQRLFGLAGRYDQVNVKAAPGVSAQQLRDRLAAIIPPGVEAVVASSAAASQAQQLNSQLGILTYFLAGFAGVSLFVGAFVIWNTFAIMIGQRTRELALLRALGARREQVFRSVLGEAALLGTVAALGGALLGILLAKGLAALLSAFGAALPTAGLVVPAAGLAASCAAGLAITVIAAILPAWRATRVAPIQALRDAAPRQDLPHARRLIAGLAVTGAGAALLMTGLFIETSAALVAAAAATCFIGVTILGPLIARPLAYLVGVPLSRLPAMTGALARDNAMRNPKRTSATAAALMIGLTLIVAASVLTGSIRAVIGSQIGAAGNTRFYVQAANADAGLTPRLARVLAAVPGVTRVTEVRTTDATVAGATHKNVDGIDPSEIGQFTALGLRSGSLAGLNCGGFRGVVPPGQHCGGVLVSQAAASAHHWRPGDHVTIQFGSYGTARLRISGVFSNVGPLSDYLVSSTAFTADTGIRTDSVDFVKAPASARGPLRRALAGYPGAQLLDQAGFASSRGQILGNILNLITALLLLAIIIALLGIVNTLALSVVERTRELGLLRAIGMRRRQLAQMIAAESVIIATIGAALGTVLGLGLGAALAEAFTRAQEPTVVVPVARIAVYVVAAILAGVLAAIAPARRAARMNMLQAIATE